MVSFPSMSINKCDFNSNRVYFLNGGLGETMGVQKSLMCPLTDGIRSFGALGSLVLNRLRMTTFGRITAARA